MSSYFSEPIASLFSIWLPHQELLRGVSENRKKNLKSLTLHVMYYFRENQNSLFSLRTHSFSYRGHRPLLHQIPEVNHHCTGNFLLHVAQCKELIKLIVIVQSDFFCLLCSILKFTIIIFLETKQKFHLSCAVDNIFFKIQVRQIQDLSLEWYHLHW